MNARDAILAHAQWKIKLTAYLNNPDGSINIETLGADNKCELGKWIYGEGARHAALPEMAALKAAHAKFHRAAADVVLKVNAGKGSADTLLGMKSEFGSASVTVVNVLRSMEAKIG